MDTKKYFTMLEEGVNGVYELAKKARAKGFDPVDDVEIFVARNMAERVEGLISSVTPQIKGCGIVERIEELETKYGKGDFRVAFTIALEVAQKKFCGFDNQKEAMEVGLRVGLAYLTNGVVASPLEGFTRLELKKRRDGKGDYFCLYFAGPIRSAGTTAMCAFVCLADYVRHEMGYVAYDPTKEEVRRVVTEVYDFHERITNLQYLPSEEELEYMAEKLPVQIDGEPTEKLEVSNYKDLERIETNRLRNGVCLVFGEGLTQKAKKFFGIFSHWYNEFDMGHWEFLKGFLNLQTKIRAKEKKGDVEDKIKPDFNYIKDIVAGRPVLGHPLRTGGLRLRYGRARNTGLSSCALHPATMAVLKNYIAIGTQIKIERPSKGTALSACDLIEGPIVKLKNGDVLFLDDAEKAKEITNSIEEIIFLGDILICYGDFFDRGHSLVPTGYCEEWWLREVEKALEEKGELVLKVDKGFMKKMGFGVNFDDALIISTELDVPLHPRWVYHWSDINKKQFLSLIRWLSKGKLGGEKLILPLIYEAEVDLEQDDPKGVLELLGVPHKVVNKENVIIFNDDAKAFAFSVGWGKEDYDVLGKEQMIEQTQGMGVLDIINRICGVKVRDKSGTFIGARMGRPEKAKIRKLTGSPQVLFPVGEEGGKMRSFNFAFSEGGVVRSNFPIFYCEGCGRETIYPKCETCGSKTKKMFYCKECNAVVADNVCKKHNGECADYKSFELDIRHYLNSGLSKLGVSELPALIKGVKGTSNKCHVPENLSKGILRALHNIYVNKDGTVRYDMTELPLTSFKPCEIGTSVKKLRELGYDTDISGEELVDEGQIVELKPQDVVLPLNVDSPEEGADKILSRVASFIDDLLERLYGLEKFYDIKNKGDLVGHFLVGLAPHISTGTVCRIIGFSKTQGFYAHPLFHCAVRRDCFDYDTYVPLKKDGVWKIEKIGDVVEGENVGRVVDGFGTKEKNVGGIEALGFDNGVGVVGVKNFTKHTKRPVLKIKTALGKEIKVTDNHKFLVDGKVVRASELKIGDKLPLIKKINIPEKDIKYFNLLELLKDENIMVRGIKKILSKVDKDILIKKAGYLGISRGKFSNYWRRDSFPVNFIMGFDRKIKKEIFEKGKIAIKRDNVGVPILIPVDKDLLEVIGLYVAEGYARSKGGKKGLSQVDISICDKQLKSFVKKTCRKYFGLVPTHETYDRVVFSSKILYLFFVKVLGCGFRAVNKRTPSIFLDLKLDKLASFLRGYFEGDGSAGKGERRVSCDSISEGLLHDLEFCLARFGIFAKRYDYEKVPGPKVREFYIRKNRDIPTFRITRLTIGSDFVEKFMKIGFLSERKKKILESYKKINCLGMRIQQDRNFVYAPIVSIEEMGEKESYCLEVDSENHLVVANSIVTKNCDGDEVAVMLLMDALINFSREYLPAHRGARQDTPLVLTPNLIPSEVDDMVFKMDVVDKYPLELYEAGLEYKMPWEVKIKQVSDLLKENGGFFGYRCTHNTFNLNNGVLCSAYKTIPNMQEKVYGQIEIAEKIRAVDEADVARLVIERHFIRDIKGNLRKFSMQQFRCVKCNEKYRRPPLVGNCLKCGGRIIFTVAKGSIIKYLEPSISLAERFDLPAYLQQTLELTKLRIESLFGKEKERQEGLKKWFV